jgi:PAS domain S-box-containing protein
MAEMLGCSETEMIGRPVLDYVDPCSIPDVLEKFRRRTTGLSDRYDIVFRKKSGEHLYTRVNASPMFSESGTFLGSVVSIVDVTRQKYSEDALKLSNGIFSIANQHTETRSMMREMVRLLQEYTSCECVGFRLLDPEGNIPYPAYAGFSREFYEMESPLNINTDECMCIYVIRGEANPDLPVITPNGSFYCNATTRFLSTVSDEDKGRTRNICNETGYESVALVAIKRGTEIIGLVHLADHREGMVPLETVQVLENISQALGSVILRSVAESNIRESLAEKEILLREVHHRVKNNLASIISLIGLQTESIGDPELTVQMDELKSRIKSMSLVHESLYRADNITEIDLKQYVTSLTEYLIHSTPRYPRVRTQINTGNLTLPLDLATPCGLILNEIVTNALKHAFPHDVPGEKNTGEPCLIFIDISTEDGMISLIAGDNGIGMDTTGSAPRVKKLGTFLIDFIVRHQLRGEINRDSSSGTVYTIRFPGLQKKTEQGDNVT